MIPPYDPGSHASPAGDAFAVAAPTRPTRAAGRGRGALHRPAPDPPSGGPLGPEPPRMAERLVAERRLLRTGLAISVALHVVFFLGLRALWVEVPVDSRAGPPEVAEVPGTRVVQLVETEAATVERDEATPRDSEATPPAPNPAGPDEAPGPPAGEAAPARRGVAERLRPTERDPRLWSLPDAVDPAGLSPEDRRRVELAARMEALGDSAAAAQAAAARAYDWTVGDDDGGKWGISPGMIHLGKVTLPLPAMLGTSLGGPAGAEAARRAADWEAIQAQAARAGLSDDFDARVKAIRERKEQERKAQQGQGDPPPG